MKTEISHIDKDLLKALLLGGKIIIHKSRSNHEGTINAHVVIVEMPKNVTVKDFNIGGGEKYWRFLVFLNTPDVGGWWHASSNNLTAKKNITKAWEEWSEFKHYTNQKEIA